MGEWILNAPHSIYKYQGGLIVAEKNEAKKNNAKAQELNAEGEIKNGAKVITSNTEVKTQAESKEVKGPSASELIKQAEKASIELSDEEKTSLEVVTGESAGKKFKLSDPKTQYGEEGFTLAGDQEKELPEDPSDALVARIRSGFIIEA